MYDWNRTEPNPWSTRRPRLVDETLRDGLQSASSTDPPLSRKIDLLYAMVEIGVDSVSVGYPAAGPRALAHATTLANEIVTAKLPLVPTAAGRTTEGDVRAVAEASERAGVPIAVYAFISSSPIRAFVEGWDLELLRRRIRTAAETARSAGLPFCLVSEDTTRTPPEIMRVLFAEAVDGGASRVCVCDTVGHADAWGARAIVLYTKRLLVELGAEDVAIDWHGHNDRGLALGNALAAALAGADAVHGTARGIGERAGNTPMELLIAQLAAAGTRRAPSQAALERYIDLAVRNHDVAIEPASMLGFLASPGSLAILDTS